MVTKDGQKNNKSNLYGYTKGFENIKISLVFVI